MPGALKNRICTTLEHLAAEDALQKSQFSKSPVLLGSALPTAKRAQHSAPSAYCTAASCVWEAECTARACAQEASGSGKATKLAPGQFDEEKKGSHEPKLETSRVRGAGAGERLRERAGCQSWLCPSSEVSSGCLHPAAVPVLWVLVPCSSSVIGLEPCCLQLCSLSEQHPLLLICSPLKHPAFFPDTYTLQRGSSRKASTEISSCKSKHCSMWVVCLSGASVLLLLGKAMPGSICLQQIIAMRTGPGFVLKRF